MENDHADRKQSGPLLPKFTSKRFKQEQIGKSVPSVDRPSAGDGQAPKEPKKRLRPRRSFSHEKAIKILSLQVRSKIHEQALPENIREALDASGWDLTLASRVLNMSVAKLDDALRQVKIIPRALKELKRLPRLSKEYARLSMEQVEQDILRRNVMYRSDSLDAIHELAMMPLSDQSGLMQVKLAAASRLYQETGDHTVGSEIDVTLRALNDAYHQNAPRIKSIRERTIEFEPEPKLVSDQ